MIWRCYRLVFLRYGKCGDFSLLFTDDNLKRKGCASTLRLLCEQCGWKHSFWTSKKQGKSFEITRRVVYGVRTLGKGYAGTRKFCTVMNIPPPPTEKAFPPNSHVIGRHIKVVAKEIVKKGGEEVFSVKKHSNSCGANPVNCDQCFM